MEQSIQFESGQFEAIQFDEYAEDEFSIVQLDFLGTNPNSHQLYFSDDVFRRDIGSALGKWIVADLSFCVDCGTHDAKEQIIGRVPETQEIQIVEQDGYLRAKCYGVISKIYSQNFCQMFEETNHKSVSVEFKAITEHGRPTEDNVNNFNIVGITVLGNQYKPSSPNSNIEFIRFAEADADAYFNKFQKNSLQQFAEARRKKMVRYKIDKSKESAVDTSWGDVDKTELRNKILSASNKTTLVKAVYLLVEDGWVDAPSEHLKYPVMQFKGDTLVYNLNAISSAQAYAEQHNETGVLNKIKILRKKLGMNDDSDKKEETKMEKVDFASVSLLDIYGKIRRALNDRSGWKYDIEGVYEDNGQKFVVLHECEADKYYRVDFKYTTEGLELATEKAEVQKEFITSETITAFAELEDVDYSEFKFCAKEEFAEPESKEEDSATEEEKDEPKDEKFEEKSEEEEEVKEEKEEFTEEFVNGLKKEIEDKEHVIMEQNAELESLREFKAGIENEQMCKFVNDCLAQIKDYVDDAQYAEFVESSKEVKFENMQGWKNSIMAQIGENMVQFGANTESEKFRMSISHDVTKVTNTVQDAWSRL